MTQEVSKRKINWFNVAAILTFAAALTLMILFFVAMFNGAAVSQLTFVLLGILLFGGIVPLCLIVIVFRSTRKKRQG